MPGLVFKTPRKRFLILICYWIIGFVLTHIPLRSEGAVLVTNVDKVVHFFLYGGLSFVMATWIGTHRKTVSTVVLTLLICCAYAVLDEGLQAFIPTRDASLGDWIADMVGTLAGCLCYGMLVGRTSNRASRDE